MKKLFLLLAALAVIGPMPANAGVHVGIGIGGPGYYGYNRGYYGRYYGGYPYGYGYPYYGNYGGYGTETITADTAAGAMVGIMAVAAASVVEDVAAAIAK